MSQGSNSDSKILSPASDTIHSSEVVRLPTWLRRESGLTKVTRELKTILREHKLNTVCEEARCPNISECFSRGTATFMILGDVCTRGCRFCSVSTGRPSMKESEFQAEALQVVNAIKLLDLNYAVITSVARDDLEDGGASGFVSTILAIREDLPNVSVEVLIPDFRGNLRSLEKIVVAKPDVLNHNIETVPRLYRRVRPGASLKRSLSLLKRTKELDPSIKTKTGIMLGLGESWKEIVDVMYECSENEIDIFTAGQYMRPTREHLPVEKYLKPEEFEEIADFARTKNLFKEIYMGPLVRSSYHAGELASRVS